MKNTALVAGRIDVKAEVRHDGSVILSNGLPLPEIEGTIPGRLRHWADKTPEALFLTQESRELRYGEAERIRRCLASRLVGLRLTGDRPLMIVADNGIDHALLMLAATSIGVPVAIVSPSYVAPGARPWTKFARIADQITPALVVTDAPALVGEALAASSVEAAVHDISDNAWLLQYPEHGSAEVDEAERSVGLDSVAKLLFTSGSTGAPKAVPNTQRMMVSNMLGLSAVWPFLSERPPVSVDWLPWNHTFGGNCCFNTTLWFGGHSHIDSGRPTPGAILRSVAALRKWRPNLYYNVPVGFEAIMPFLEGDADFAGPFLGELDFVFNGGAPMPPALRSRLEAVALRTIGRSLHIVAGWGATETAPFSTVLYFDQPHANNLGAPMPGTRVKMVPSDERFELRVKGPNVMPGYWRDPVATEAAFDEEGFYKIGDAAKFAKSGDPSEGILFDGRVAENFKLTSGTWVNVGALRLAVVSAMEKLVSDTVVAGEGRGDIRLLLFPNEVECRALLRAVERREPTDVSIGAHPKVRARIAELLRAYNDRQMGSSTRIAGFIILDEPPSPDHDEINDKGYINQRKVLSRRPAVLEKLYSRESVLGQDA